MHLFPTIFLAYGSVRRCVPTCLPEIMHATRNNTNVSRETLGIVCQIESNLFEPPTSFGSRVPRRSTPLPHFTSVSSSNSRGDEDVQSSQPLTVKLTGWRCTHFGRDAALWPQ